MLRKSVLLLTSGAVATASNVTPVQKVLQMMGEMVAKGEKGMEDERKIMATYDEWVSDETTRLTQNMKTASDGIEKLTAFITKASNDIEVLGGEISELDDLIAQKQSELAEATKIREEENAEYVSASTDLGESVDALGRAIDTLKSENYDRGQAMLQLQKMAVSSKGMRPVLAAFLEESSKSHADGAPDVAAYEFQSGGVIEMMEGLLDKFEKQLAEVEGRETAAQQNYDMNKVQLTDLLAHSTRSREEKAATKADLTAQNGKAQGDLATTKASKAADEKTLAEMTSIHEQKTEVFAANQDVRKQELAALNKAIEIISAPNVADSYAGHVNFVQKPSFLQTQSTSHRVAAKNRAAVLLKKRALTLNSKTLSTLATEINANPFAKVVDMIKTLLAKLKEEAAAEADHKAWCDKELKDNKRKRNKKTADSEKLMAEIEDLSAKIDSMGNKIATLLQEQDDLTTAMGEATSDRTAEKAENTATIEDAAAGAEAVKSALVVLRDFYNSQSAFIQQVPQMKAYGGMQSANGGVVGMLEVIVSDFVRLEAETKAAETQAAAEFDAFMRDAKADKIAKHKEEVKTKLEKDQAEFDREGANKMLVGVNEELAKANSYYEQLKPECTEVQVSYEERAAGRKAEIQALKDAYATLDQKGQE
jgi:predicted  nucleic acid-binding Zn-ribbon protein